MYKLIFAILFGAALMYLLDPRQGQERRQALTDKFRDRDNLGGRAQGVVDAGKETVHEAKERAQTVVSNAKDRFGQTIEQAREGARETVTEAKDNARDLAQSAQERAHAAGDNNKS